MRPRHAVAALLAAAAPLAHAAGDVLRGASAFHACAQCHSVEAGENLTGPSLARIVGRKAASEPGFSRYSDALKRSGLVWDEPTLDRWLADPAQLVPGTAMAFAGVRQAQTRENIIAYLKTADGRPGSDPMQRPKLDLKSPPPEGQVRSIRRCGDTYTVETADGRTEKVWEFNLRFKTDSGKRGPAAGKPAAIAAGMHGDRTAIVFASPAEISAFVQEGCP
jgi:cytochrome c